MEKDLKIPLSKGKALYGKFNGSIRQSLYITVHGLPGDVYEGLHERACHWFARQGYATFRFNLYSWQKDARQLVDCTLKTHASDLDTVVRYFRKRGVKKIYVSGHSYGGPTILLSKNQDFNAVALWDPSYDISFTRMKYGYPGGKFVRTLNGYFMRWGVNVVIGKAMAKEADTLRWSDLTKKFHVPLKIVAAEKGVLVPGAKMYFTNAHEPKDLEMIKGATHYFDDQDKLQERVFELSKKWFQRF